MNLLQKQNTKYDLIIFDFDGTIADTSEGIIDSHKYTLRFLNLPIPSDKELRRLIGNNLLRTYMEVFGLDEVNARHAVDIYRERYSIVGIHKATIYPYFLDMLCKLKNVGCKIGLATLKSELFAITMLKDMNCLSFFDYVFGMDERDSETKSSLIKKCIDSSLISSDRCLFVGDTIGDYDGAKDNEIAFVGVTYGFGFKKKEIYNFPIVNNPNQIVEFVMGNQND